MSFFLRHGHFKDEKLHPAEGGESLTLDWRSDISALERSAATTLTQEFAARNLVARLIPAIAFETKPSTSLDKVTRVSSMGRCRKSEGEGVTRCHCDARPPRQSRKCGLLSDSLA
jgi:hypothetical protein